MPRCDWLLPGDYLATFFEERVVPCLLPANHEGDHLSRLPDETYALWISDPECGCPGEDYCGCIVIGEVSREEAAVLLGEGETSAR